MPKRVVWGGVTLLALLLVAGVVWQVVGRDGSTPTPAAARVTTLAELARADPAVTRAAFCDQVPTARVAEALGGPVASTDGYDNGDTVPLGSVGDDVAHEYGCSWTGESGAVLRAWVFAPPVTPSRAKRLARLAVRAEGCAAYTPAGGAAFGDPSAAFTCTAGDQLVAGHAGLFGDAWLSCTLTAPAADSEPADLQSRADEWCVGVAVAAS